MSKYTPLWKYISQNGAPSLKLRFPKELLEYGYQVEKISMKNQTVLFGKTV